MVKRCVVGGFLLSMLVVQAGGALARDTVKLEYKFKPNELLRYKMVMNMNMTLDMPGFEQTMLPNTAIQMVAVYRQRTKRVLANGDAEITAAVESIKMTMGGKTESIPADKIPVMTFVMSKNGVVKSMSGLEKMAAQFGGMQFVNPSAMGQYGALPEGELSVGDTWSQEIPFPLGEGKLNVTGKILSTDTKLGKYTVAAIKQNMGGHVAYSMTIPASPGQTAPASGSVNAKGKFLGDAVVYFSQEKGQMIRTDGNLTMQMSMEFTNAPANAPSGMEMDMDMDFEMFLLP